MIAVLKADSLLAAIPGRSISLNERPLTGSGRAGVNDRNWVKLLRRESIDLSDLPVMDQAPAAWSNPE
ncbi:hypothetical protein [Sphingomonas dokdonensis]|uniref:hypothetical protein n=1 Tax=Sphingomonas dokdonensis TaxID=344880 RepID=UPI00117B7E4F|nr:hypothetical protein [Sphingomonas dokdonensis]